MKKFNYVIKKNKMAVLTVIIIMLNSLNVFGFIDIPPTNDIQFMTHHGHMITGTRCGSKDTADISVRRGPGNLFQWRQMTPMRTEKITIPIAFHIIMKSSGEGNVTDEQINQQVDVLNNAYAPMNIGFEIHSINRITNNFYYGVQPGILEFFMKLQYSVDPANTLNFYTASPGGGLLGWATFPWMHIESSFQHGIVLLNESLPGGSAQNYNGGDTAVHEIGHYLGLYHTFQGGCMAPGDHVDDTPFQAEANYGCPVGTDSCSTPGLDPVYNFMNYTYDSCMNSFTQKQIDRVEWALSEYKKSLTR